MRLALPITSNAEPRLSDMILGPISWVDCIVFLIFLAPQLVVHVGFLKTAICGITALPFLLLQMPVQLISERYLTSHRNKTPFVQHATLFQDIVIRCVRYAFAYIPASIGKVFFSKGVSLPFLRFRMLRHGHLRHRIHWKEVDRNGLRGVYMINDSTRRPDIIIYYCHGGGFSMGSSYFYLEFLLVWLSLLKDEGGYSNPAIFALEYTLVPQATYPTQVQETLQGYKYLLSIVDDPGQIVVSGDSAGATLILSLMLTLSRFSGLKNKLPGLAVLISPWAAIISPKNQNTTSDYLNAESLHLYGSQYIGKAASPQDPIVSPASCLDVTWWTKSAPEHGFCFVYGAEEVFAPECEALIWKLKKAGLRVEAAEEKGWVHAWPVVKLFLCETREERLSGLRLIVTMVRKRIEPSGDT